MTEPREPIESRSFGNGEIPPAMQRRMDTFTEGKPPQSQLGKALYEQFSMLSLAVMSTGDFYCAKIIALNAAPLATAYDDLAKKNARVKEVLEMIVSGGAWTGAVMATAAVAIPIAQHHGLYPEEWPNPFTLGIVPPSEEVTEHDATRPTPRPLAGWPDPPHPRPRRRMARHASPRRVRPR